MKQSTSTVWRQGDVFIVAIDRVPSGRRESHSLVLALGEVTGHAHRIAENEAATACRMGTQVFLEVTGAQATLTHDEHAPITLPRGAYEIRIQREYAPAKIRRVAD
ncbi:MAG: hypothetical protein V4773_04780 [Verrucomicrobiota bacterium]